MDQTTRKMIRKPSVFNHVLYYISMALMTLDCYGGPVRDRVRTASEALNYSTANDHEELVTALADLWVWFIYRAEEPEDEWFIASMLCWQCMEFIVSYEREARGA